MLSLLLPLLVAAMAMGGPTAVGQNDNTLANPHLARKVGDFVVETAAGVRKHRLVKRGTTDKKIVACGDAERSLGWVQYRIKDSEHLTDSDYAVGDVLKIERGATRVAILASGSAAVVEGDLLCPAAAGKVRKAVLATLADVVSAVGYATESLNPAASDLNIGVEAF
jgi:hypothetical protein